MAWNIKFTKRADKGFSKVPEKVQLRLFALIRKMEIYGPFLEAWPSGERSKFKNYGKLEGAESKYHCHLKRGRPTYVVCWEIYSKTIIVEFYYVGTHEKAPY